MTDNVGGLPAPWRAVARSLCDTTKEKVRVALLMFKNLVVYRVSGPGGAPLRADLATWEDALSKAQFLPCGATQPVSIGWVPPRAPQAGDGGAETAPQSPQPLVESVGGQWLMQLVVEQKVLPSAVVKRRTQELARQIERATGRKPGKKQSKELKEEATLALLPQAFTKQASINVWLDPKAALLMVDAGSAKRAEEAVSLLVQSLDGQLALRLVQTALSPAVAMTAWLASGEPPPGFSVDRECELKSADEMKSVVRYARHPLDTEEVKAHVQTGGKQPTRLAMTWKGRVSFVLTDAFQIKKLSVDDSLFDAGSSRNGDDDFDADAAIATGELRQLIPDLVAALDGELAEATESSPAVPTPAADAPDASTPPWAEPQTA
jgi:recombination associated protein RdgC